MDQPVAAARLDCVSNDTGAVRAVGLEPAEQAAWAGFLRAHSELTRALDAELVEAHDLPLSSYEVLLRLARAPGRRLRMSDLADSVVLSRSGLTRLADRLEKTGLVTRQECPTDQRGLFLVITDDGERLFNEARRTHLDGVRERFLGQLEPDEQRTLAEVWDRLL
jgi:DNA-binding MarR family transcriptional regulator